MNRAVTNTIVHSANHTQPTDSRVQTFDSLLCEGLKRGGQDVASNMRLAVSCIIQCNHKLLLLIKLDNPYADAWLIIQPGQNPN